MSDYTHNHTDLEVILPGLHNGQHNRKSKYAETSVRIIKKKKNWVINILAA